MSVEEAEEQVNSEVVVLAKLAFELAELEEEVVVHRGLLAKTIVRIQVLKRLLAVE